MTNDPSNFMMIDGPLASQGNVESRFIGLEGKDIQIERLLEALRAASYYIERLERAQMRKRVADMTEAMEHYLRTAIPLLAAYVKEEL